MQNEWKTRALGQGEYLTYSKSEPNVEYFTERYTLTDGTVKWRHSRHDTYKDRTGRNRIKSVHLYDVEHRNGFDVFNQLIKKIEVKQC